MSWTTTQGHRETTVVCRDDVNVSVFSLRRLGDRSDRVCDQNIDRVDEDDHGDAGATAATQRTITATITNIDPKIPSISFSGPNGWKYSSRVEDKEALKKVKVGDRPWGVTVVSR